MFAESDKFPLRWLRALALVLFVPAFSVHGQEAAADAERALISFSIASASMLDEAGGLIKVARTAETRDLRNGLVEDALNYSLGLQTSPVEGLKLDANLWRSQFDQFDAAPLRNSSVPQPNLRSSGFDVGAAYVWNTNRFGQFTLSTRASYVRDFYNTEGLLEAVNGNLPSAKLATPDLRSNLKLSWEFGNHTATAITRYFDSSRDLSELGMEEINDLVDNIATVDLEYGYRMAVGSNDRAVISFGIQNVFDRKTMQILNSATRVLDQNGRVAYGRLKYQF